MPGPICDGSLCPGPLPGPCPDYPVLTTDAAQQHLVVEGERPLVVLGHVVPHGLVDSEPSQGVGHLGRGPGSEDWALYPAQSLPMGPGTLSSHSEATELAISQARQFTNPEVLSLISVFLSAPYPPWVSSVTNLKWGEKVSRTP